MIIFLEEFKLLLTKLLSYKIDFILIGGYAVNFHGYNRPTGDMDIWLRPNNDTKEKLIALFKEEGFSNENLHAIMLSASWRISISRRDPETSSG